jgi:hypothetical protein
VSERKYSTVVGRVVACAGYGSDFELPLAYVRRDMGGEPGARMGNVGTIIQKWRV